MTSGDVKKAVRRRTSYSQLSMEEAAGDGELPLPQLQLVLQRRSSSCGLGVGCSAPSSPTGSIQRRSSSGSEAGFEMLQRRASVGCSSRSRCGFADALQFMCEDAGPVSEPIDLIRRAMKEHCLAANHPAEDSQPALSCHMEPSPDETVPVVAKSVAPTVRCRSEDGGASTGRRRASMPGHDLTSARLPGDGAGALHIITSREVQQHDKLGVARSPAHSAAMQNHPAIKLRKLRASSYSFNEPRPAFMRIPMESLTIHDVAHAGNTKQCTSLKRALAVHSDSESESHSPVSVLTPTAFNSTTEEVQNFRA